MCQYYYWSFIHIHYINALLNEYMVWGKSLCNVIEFKVLFIISGVQVQTHALYLKSIQFDHMLGENTYMIEFSDKSSVKHWLKVFKVVIHDSIIGKPFVENC